MSGIRSRSGGIRRIIRGRLIAQHRCLRRRIHLVTSLNSSNSLLLAHLGLDVFRLHLLLYAPLHLLKLVPVISNPIW
jgi:hypothetical protein